MISPVLVVNIVPVHADEVAQVQVPEDVELLVAQHVLLGVDLDAAAVVLARR